MRIITAWNVLFNTGIKECLSGLTIVDNSIYWLDICVGLVMVKMVV